MSVCVCLHVEEYTDFPPIAIYNLLEVKIFSHLKARSDPERHQNTIQDDVCAHSLSEFNDFLLSASLKFLEQRKCWKGLYSQKMDV